MKTKLRNILIKEDIINNMENIQEIIPELKEFNNDHLIGLLRESVPSYFLRLALIIREVEISLGDNDILLRLEYPKDFINDLKWVLTNYNKKITTDDLSKNYELVRIILEMRRCEKIYREKSKKLILTQTKFKLK